MTRQFIDTPAARIGREIHRLCSEQNIFYKEVAERCNASLKALFPSQRFGPIREERIARLVEASQNPTARGVAKQVEDYELVAIPHALHFSLDEVFGSSFRRHALVWDPLADPHYSENVLKLLKQHGEHARELVGWAEFLPCSMETPEFMRAHHDRLFRGQITLSVREWHQLMQQYNEFGDRRRHLALSPERKWNLKHLMRVSDLELIVFGTGEYSFDKTLRKAQIQHLANLVAKPENKIELILAEDAEIKPIEKHLRDYDSQFCIDERLTVWRNHGGRMTWSEDPGLVAQHRALLQEFERVSSCKRLKDVHDRLVCYLEEIR
jgi:hypothetical protein